MCNEFLKSVFKIKFTFQTYFKDFFTAIMCFLITLARFELKLANFIS